MSNKVKYHIADGTMVACYLMSGYLIHDHWGYSLAFLIMGTINKVCSLAHYKEIQ